LRLLIDQSKGDNIIDYRNGIDATVQGIQQSFQQAGQSAAWYAIDYVTIPDSMKVLQQKAVQPGGKINCILPNDIDLTPAVKMIVSVGSVHGQPELELHRQYEIGMDGFESLRLHKVLFATNSYRVSMSGGLKSLIRYRID